MFEIARVNLWFKFQGHFIVNMTLNLLDMLPLLEPH